ncbi:MAG: CHAT domain-containing protein [Flavobacteriales bacterium]
MKFVLYNLIFLFCSFLNAQNTPDHYIKKINFLTQKAYQYLYTNQDSSYYFIDQVYQIAKKNKDWESEFTILSASTKSASYFYDLTKMSSSLKQLDTVLKNHKKEIENSPNNQFINNSYLFDYGIYFNELNNYKKARTYFNILINNIEKTLDEKITSYNIDLLHSSYNYLASMYSHEGKYNLAKQYYLKNIEFISEKKPADFRLLYNDYSLLAQVYKKEKHYQKSNKFLRKALSFNLKKRNATNRIIKTCLDISENFLNLKKTDSAFVYLDIAKNHLTENHAFWYQYYIVQAKLFNQEQKYSLAEEAYQKSIMFVNQKWKGERNTEIGQAYNEIGEFEIENNHLNKALVYFNEAQKQLLQEPQTSSALQNSILFNTQKNKASIFNTLKKYKKANQVVTNGIHILDRLKPTFKNKTDKLLLIENAFSIVESGLEANYQLYRKSNNKRYIDTAFYFSEKSKSALLLEALLSTKAASFGTIPASLLEKEKQLKAQITNQEKIINTSKNKNQKHDEKLFKLNQQYRNLIKEIETTYPSYYNLKYNTHVIGLKELQKKLKLDELFISYSYGNEALYAISIDKKNADFIKIDIDSTTKKQVNSIYTKLSNPASNIQTLADETFVIYKQILQPLLKNKEIKHLIINTDGILNYLPFSSFNTSKDDIHYLVNNYNISYVNSASLWNQLKNHEVKNTKLLAFAPSFLNENKSSFSTLLPLPNNIKELDLIETYFKEGVYLKDKEANLSNFKKDASQFNIIHLATHAVLNDEQPEFSYLAFSPSKKEDYLLYVSDLYNLQLNASLVTLSACESGIGDLKHGEGFISLAQGFFYSGAESVTNTLWKINDHASTQIMGDFYKNLKLGNSKSIALQKAKQQFLIKNKQNALSHPYYWSSFILSGNTKPIVDDNSMLWICIGSLVLIPLLFFLFRKKS